MGGKAHALTFLFFSFQKEKRGVRAVMKNKWPKSSEKTGFGGTLDLARENSLDEALLH